MSGEVNMTPTLRKFRGGQSKQNWGGSLETFSGEAQLKKKHPVAAVVDISTESVYHRLVSVTAECWVTAFTVHHNL